MEDKEKKQQFDEIWEKKIEKNNNKLFEYFPLYSSRQIYIGDTLKLHLEDTGQIIYPRVVEKPSYFDRYGKPRYRGYFRCKQEKSDDIIVCHLRHIMKLIKSN